ncbi:hypothetical protein [Desulfotignum phosphitoxidans]|jgi:hypothetical protein|uniref:Uncharacterized protein n=1 Tax=Desulfotignum phosphitoxidans DSM 13687 TaxID=1286635 RepID=S0FSY7_9BACT|nr:hypothetical protein [Desulfotignum phosphitoxidans]EMS77800.1 hypothetical protein Dpo_12c00780 [Desulfotignum phosphitoxidans DSM 13687]
MKKQRQRALQISLGLGMLVIVILVEVLAISPAGIYSYTLTGYRNFKIGAPRQRILAEINRVPAIRTLITCTPDSETMLLTQRHFTHTPELDVSDVWIARYRNHNVIIFLFKEQTLSRILLLKTRFSRQISSALFDTCRLDLLEDIDLFLENQTVHPVFYH